MEGTALNRLTERAHLSLSEDELEAQLSVPDPEGLQELSAEELEDFLRLHGVVEGIVREALVEAAASLRKGRPLDGYVVARGRPPVAPDGTRVEFRFDTERLTGALLADGRVDYRERSSIVQVRAGDVLCELQSEKPGSDGVTVTGKRLKALPAKHVKGPKPGRNVRFDPERGVYQATVSGAVFLRDNVLSVRTEVTIPGDVDYEIGNIRFAGNVIVRGTVKSGFLVEAEGNVTIIGGIEPKARVVAAGDVVVQGVCRGAGKEGPVTVRSGRTVTLGVVQDAVIVAEGDILLRKPVVGSTIQAGGMVKALEPEAIIRASYVEGVRGLHLQTVGSPTAQPCHLVAGITARVADRIEAVEREIQQLTDKLNAVCEAFYKRYEKLLLSSRLDDEERNELEEAKAQANDKQRKLDEKVQALRHERRVLQKELKQDPVAACIVEGTLFPVAFVRLHDNKFVLRGEVRRNVVLYRLNGQVVCHDKEQYERHRREAEADPEGLSSKLKQGKLNEAELVAGLERYNATLDTARLKTALAVGLKAVKNKRYQNAATWTQIAWSMALLARRVPGGPHREKLLSEALQAAQSARALRSMGPGAYAAFGLVASERGDTEGAIAAFREAVKLARSGGRRRSLSERDDAVFVLYAYFLHRAAGRLLRENRAHRAQKLREEGRDAAAEYLRRHPKGPWANLARSLAEGPDQQGVEST